MSEAQKIMLAGIDYAIPTLAIKQNQHIEPLVAKHSDYFLHVARNEGRVKLLDITPEQAEDFVRIVYYALTRARPDLTFEEFERMPISMQDIMVALPTCINQSGLYRPAPEVAPPTGEEQPSTGIS